MRKWASVSVTGHKDPREDDKLILGEVRFTNNETGDVLIAVVKTKWAAKNFIMQHADELGDDLLVTAMEFMEKILHKLQRGGIHSPPYGTYETEKSARQARQEIMCQEIHGMTLRNYQAYLS